MLDEMLLEPSVPSNNMPTFMKYVISTDKPLSWVTRLMRTKKLDLATRNMLVIPYLATGSTLEPKKFKNFADAYIGSFLNSEEAEECGKHKEITALRSLAVVCIFADMYGLGNEGDWDANMLLAYRNPATYGYATKLFSEYVKQEGMRLVALLRGSDSIN